MKNPDPSFISRLLNAVAFPVIGIGLLALLDSQTQNGKMQLPYLNQGISIAWIFLSVGLAYRLICLVGIDFFLARSTGRQVPKILKHIIGIAAACLTILLSANVVHSGALTGLIALSSVVAVVIGLALRPVILDVFSGLSANLDSAFYIGDWIEITGRNGGPSYTGWVEEINWRTTHLKTRSGNLIVCPNSMIGTAVIVNFSRPSGLSRYDIEVNLPPEIDADRAQRILLNAVQATVGTDKGPSSEPAPFVMVRELSASGVKHRVSYWLDPATHSIEAAADRVSRSVLRHLQMAGIPLAENVMLYRDKRAILDDRSRTAILEQLTIFSGIPQATLAALAEKISLHEFSPNEVLIHQGANDHHMYLLTEGAVDVIVTVDGKEMIVDRIQAGDYFGEMSMLTGEPRTATIKAYTTCIAYRIEREDIAPILESDPATIILLSRNLAERNLWRQTKIAASQTGTPEEKQTSLSSLLLGKMKSIFCVVR